MSKYADEVHINQPLEINNTMIIKREIYSFNKSTHFDTIINEFIFDAHLLF